VLNARLSLEFIVLFRNFTCGDDVVVSEAFAFGKGRW